MPKGNKITQAADAAARSLIIETLRKHTTVTAAAEELGVTHTELLRRCKRLGIKPLKFRYVEVDDG